jgi:hypothetical protein
VIADGRRPGDVLPGMFSGDSVRNSTLCCQALAIELEGDAGDTGNGVCTHTLAIREIVGITICEWSHRRSARRGHNCTAG